MRTKNEERKPLQWKPSCRIIRAMRLPRREAGQGTVLMDAGVWDGSLPSGITIHLVGLSGDFCGGDRLGGTGRISVLAF